MHAVEKCIIPTVAFSKEVRRVLSVQFAFLYVLCTNLNCKLKQRRGQRQRANSSTCTGCGRPVVVVVVRPASGARTVEGSLGYRF